MAIMKFSMDRNQSGSRIRTARYLYSPALTQVRHGLVLSKNTLSRIENGQRYVTDLELIAFADVLKVSVAWLLGETNDPTQNPGGREKRP